MSNEQQNTSSSVTTEEVAVEEEVQDNDNAPSSVSVSPQQLQPTIVTVPPRLNTNTTTTSTGNIPEDGTTIMSLDNNHNNIINNNINVVDTSKDAELAAALAAQEEQEYYQLQQQQQKQQLLLSSGMNHITLNTSHPNGHENSLLNTTTSTTNTGGNPNLSSSSSSTTTSNTFSVATISAPWQYDHDTNTCTKCNVEFNPIFNHKHHCRYCGYIFCNNCTKYKSLIPPTQIVLHPITGKKTKPITNYNNTETDSNNNHNISFTPNPDPDRMLTYITPNNNNNSTDNDTNNTTLGQQQQQQDNIQQLLLHGNGLEERILLAREPLRVCLQCSIKLQSIQDQLRCYNSNAMKYNMIYPTHIQRLFNSPIANTLGHEIRKAAYTLNNLLPQPKRSSHTTNNNAFIEINDNSYNTNNNQLHNDLQQCKDTCTTIFDSPTLQNIDGIHIPTKLLELAKGIAIITVMKTGFGFAGFEFGTGLVVARLPNIVNTNPITTPTTNDPININTNTNTSFRWSAPSAIGTIGISWGALIGAQVSDHVFLLMTDEAVSLFYNHKASIQLGADIGIAVGPIGRSIEGGINMNGQQNTITAPIYTYSMSKGLYAGISLDGKVIVTRHDVNEKFYGMSISAEEILAGVVPTPPAAQPLYDALHRCHVYATMMESTSSSSSTSSSRHRNDYNPSLVGGAGPGIVSQQQPQFYPPNTLYTTTPSMYESSSIQQEYGEVLTTNDTLQQQQQHPGIYDYPLPYNNHDNNDNNSNSINDATASSSTTTNIIDKDSKI